MQASAIVQGLARPDYYEQLTKLRSIMAEKKMSLWLEGEAAAHSNEATPDMQFLFSLLEALYDEKVVDLAKCHLLMLIEEHFDAFVTTSSSASQLVNSLLGVTATGSHGRERKDVVTPNSHGFVFQCVTAIIVRFELLETDPDLCERFVQQLLDAMWCVTGTAHLRFRSIVSLEQLELRFPTFLMWKLEQLHQVCAVDCTILFEHSLRLFCLALRHAVDFCTMEGAKWRSDLFDMRTESLRHCALQFPTIARLRKFDASCAVTRCLSDRNGQLLQYIHFALDRAKYLSFWSLVAVLDHLMRVVARFDTLSATLFKTLTLRLMPLNRPRLLFSMMCLRALFTDALYARHSAALLHTCLSHVNNSRNIIPHRLITAMWLAENVRLVEDQRVSITDLRVMQPSVFDPLDVKYAKMLFLNNFLELEDERAPVLLLSNIIGVRKLSQYAGPGKVSAALFQILLQLYLRRSSSALANDIRQLVLGITKENAEFVPYTLDFVAAVQAALPDNSLPCRAAVDLNDWACDALPDVIDSPAALHLLRLVAWAVREKSVETGPVVEVLLQLLSGTELCSDADWSKGHAFLDVCRALLEFRGGLAAGPLFQGLGDLLANLSLRHGHLDVRERAELYYSMLVHLNGTRLQSLLSETRQQATVSGESMELALRKTEGYPVLPTVCWIDTPAFALRHVPAWSPDATALALETMPAVWDAEELSQLSPEGPLLSSYLDFVRRQVTWLPLVLSLTRVPAVVTSGLLYGLEFSCHSAPAGLDLRLLTSSCAALAPSAHHLLFLELHGARVDHFEVRVSATFADTDGEPCMAESAPVVLDIIELLLPLPVASRSLQRLIVNELRASDTLLHSFMTLRPSVEQRQALLDALSHLEVEEGQFCGLLLPDSHVMLEIEEKENFCFVSVLTDRASALKHFYRFLLGFSETETLSA